MKVHIIIAMVCLIASLVMAAIAIMVSRKQKSGKKLNAGKKRNLFFAALYTRLISLPVIKSLIFSIRKRLEIYAQSDEMTVRKKSVVIALTIIVLYFGLTLLFWLVTKDYLMLLLFIAVLSFLGDTAIDAFIAELCNKLLKQQVLYLEILRHKYYEQKSVEDANYEACNLLNQKGYFEIYAQAERINDILTAPDAESALQKYYDTAPNKYLRMLAGVLYITKEYGDTKINGESVFIRCISYLGSEIKSEIFKRDKLKYALRSLNIISVIPLFAIKPLRMWASDNFVPLRNFYSSTSGIILGIVTVLITAVSYMIIRKLNSYESSAIGPGKKTVEQKLYDAGLYVVVDRLIPRGFTVKRNKLAELIKSSMAPLNLFTLYTRRIILGLSAFLLGIALFIGLNIYTRHTILYEPQMPQGFLGGRLSEQELEKLRKITDFDREIILAIDNKASFEEIKGYLTGELKLDNAEADISAKRIQEKMIKLSSNRFWWWQLLLCLSFFWAGYQSPIAHLKFMAKVRQIDMEEEVAQFHTIILMMMHMNRVHVEEVLEWMEAFSVYFREPLQKCLSNFSSDPYEALEELKLDVTFPPFVRIVENLQLACEELGMARAFEDLENEMTYNREARKENNERIVERRKNLGNIIGFLPIYALIILYLVIPMIVSGMDSISAFYRQLSQI